MPTVAGKTAVIASGIGASYVQELLPEGVSFAKIGAYPIDEEWLGEFAKKHEKILVIEELAPVVEEAVRQVAGCVPVFGKINGYAPVRRRAQPGHRSFGHGKGRVFKGKPVCRKRTGAEPPSPAAHPLRRLPPPGRLLCNEEGLSRSPQSTRAISGAIRSASSSGP